MVGRIDFKECTLSKMRYLMRRQSDYHDGGMIGSPSSHWWVPAAGLGQMPDQSALLLLKTRTIQSFFSVMIILVMTLFLVVLSDRASVVQVRLSLPPWPQTMKYLQPTRTEIQFEHDDVHPKEEELRKQPRKTLRSLATNEEHITFSQKTANKLSLGVHEKLPNREIGNHHRMIRTSRSLPHTENAATTTTKLGVQLGKPHSSSNAPPELSVHDRDHATDVQLPDHAGMEWVQFPHLADNETEQLMLQIRQNGTLPCHNIRTNRADVLGFPQLQPDELDVDKENPNIIRLYAGSVYELTIVSIGDDGQRRCAGGDYYETDLSGPLWKSRPPVLDYNNGTYSVRLQMDPRLASGVYTFKVILLFSNFHALHHHPHRWARMEEVATYQIEFVLPEPSLTVRAVLSPESSLDSKSSVNRALELPMCKLEDFNKKYWSGRWTRENATEDCEYDRYGRWRCVDANLQCQKPWCKGRVGSLESNGWVYSAHCAFKIFEKEEAWQCLDGKWLFFWGDSNHMDTIRNLLNFVLGFEHRLGFLDRRMDTTYFSPPNNRSSVRITSMFNGHSNVTMNYEGLFSLHDPQFAQQLRSYFTGTAAPDFMIMNSGLHDGMYWKDVDRFMTDGVELAADFWADVWSKMKARRPDLLYRTTVSTGGKARKMPFNPHKMELFNHLMLDRFVKMELERFHIIDGFDYTYPWHYDHKTNDGVHYGRPPSKSRWAGGNVGHRYFVDLMLVHMLLNAICAPSQQANQ